MVGDNHRNGVEGFFIELLCVLLFIFKVLLRILVLLLNIGNVDLMIELDDDDDDDDIVVID